jgi:hypothetical protein
MNNGIEPNPHVALNNARNLPASIPNSEFQNPHSDGARAIEHYIDQRDKLWQQLVFNQAELSSIAVNLLKDRNDFIDAIFRFKLIKKLFKSERIEREKQRAKICEAFIDQLQKEQQTLIRQAGEMQI